MRTDRANSHERATQASPPILIILPRPYRSSFLIYCRFIIHTDEHASIPEKHTRKSAYGQYAVRRHTTVDLPMPTDYLTPPTQSAQNRPFDGRNSPSFTLCKTL